MSFKPFDPSAGQIAYTTPENRSKGLFRGSNMCVCSIMRTTGAFHG